MRLAGQIKLGYYPAHPDAVAFIAAHLKAPDSGPFTILDPCAGEGEAVVQLAKLLGCAPANTYAVELEEGRADLLLNHEFLVRRNVAAPASFFGVTCKHGSMSLAYVNPPFDSDGCGRTENQFLDRATQLLAPRGILALVCPEKVAQGWRLKQTLASWYDFVQVLPFPEHCRPYNEVVVFGLKRREPEASHRTNFWGKPVGPYRLPVSAGPGERFFKSDLTEEEYLRFMNASPLMRHLQPKPTQTLARPPLPLNAGHIALLLASGHLDGLVCPPDEPPHLVRGTVKKVEYEASRDKQVQDDGTVTTKMVTSERIVLCVRAVTSEGAIHTFTDQEVETAEEPEAANE